MPDRKYHGRQQEDHSGQSELHTYGPTALFMWPLSGLSVSALAQRLVVVVGLTLLLTAPFLLMMIPVTQHVADRIHAPAPLLLFGLLIGACLGGNLTPIGASANIVTLGILRKRGHMVSFREFMAIGIPVTVVAVLSACAFVWCFWHP